MIETVEIEGPMLIKRNDSFLLYSLDIALCIYIYIYIYIYILQIDFFFFKNIRC